MLCVITLFSLLAVQLSRVQGSDEQVYVNVQKIGELMEGLVRQAGSQLHSMEDICSGLDSLYSGFHSLEQDVAYLCGRGSDVVYNLLSCVDDHKEDTYEDLDEIKDSLEDAKESLDRIENLVGCGGQGWRPVAIFDFTDTSTTCPGQWQLITQDGERTCGANHPGTSDCSEADFVINDPYTRVCGRVRAFQFGIPDAFAGFNSDEQDLDEPYVSGVSVTNTDEDVHIWTYAAGATEDRLHAQTAPNTLCPCDGGPDSPPYVGRNYFCESASTSRFDADATFFPNDLLWDGKDCISSSTCCCKPNYFREYFFREFESSTSDDIRARICVRELINSGDNILVQLLELYVQ